MSLPVYRYLRGYCLDPGFSTRLDTASINEAVYRVPFEKLEPGPVGDYVEVIDFDPASDCWYDPVDLGDEEIASQFGLPPSEGNPQFHQQFVYAVAMKTIGHFRGLRVSPARTKGLWGRLTTSATRKRRSRTARRSSTPTSVAKAITIDERRDDAHPSQLRNG
jgi:hypothetical protein